MENVQTDAVRFISNNKERTYTVDEMNKLCLDLLDLRRKNRRISILLKMLSIKKNNIQLRVLSMMIFWIRRPQTLSRLDLRFQDFTDQLEQTRMNIFIVFSQKR